MEENSNILQTVTNVIDYIGRETIRGYHNRVSDTNQRRRWRKEQKKIFEKKKQFSLAMSKGYNILYKCGSETDKTRNKNDKINVCEECSCGIIHKGN